MDSLHDVHALVKLEDYESVKESAQALFPTPEGSSETPQKAEDVEDEDYLTKMQTS
jgi:hypothetical protein